MMQAARYAVLAVILFVSPAVSGTPCNTHGEAIKLLTREFREERVAFGVGDHGRLYEVFARKDGGSWTILRTGPDGVSCIIAAGGAWKQIKLPLKEPEA